METVQLHERPAFSYSRSWRKREFATEMLRILKTIGPCREAPEYQDIDARRIQHNLPQSTTSLALPHQKN
jgi:hypothetical protein